MKDLNFCPRCELWNKRNPDRQERDTHYDTVLCPNCHPMKRVKYGVDKALFDIGKKLRKGEIKVAKEIEALFQGGC